MIMYNASARAAALIPIVQNGTKHSYAVDFKMVVHIFRFFYRHKNNDPPDEMLANMEKYRQPIREGRQDKRNLRFKSAVSFIYRVA